MAILMKEIKERHPEDMAWARHECDGRSRLGPQHIDPETEFVLEEVVKQSVGDRYYYRSTNGEVLVSVGGQAEPIISVDLI